MPAPRCRETGVFGDVVGDYGGSTLVHLQAAVSFWNFHPTQPQLAGFLQQLASDGEVLVLHLLDVRDNLVGSEFLRRLTNQLMLFGEILRREYFVGRALFEQKAAARDLGFGNRGCGHPTPFLTTKDTKVHNGKLKHQKLSATSCPSWLFLLLPARSAHEALDAVLQMDNIEVYKQAKRFATELQVRKYLGLMDRRDGHAGDLQGAILDIAEPHRKVIRHMLVVFPSCTFVPFVVIGFERHSLIVNSDFVNSDFRIPQLPPSHHQHTSSPTHNVPCGV